MKLNKFLLAGAGLSLATFFLHVFGGGPEFLDIIFATQDLPAKQQALYGVLWHMVSAFLLIATAAFALASKNPQYLAAVHFTNALNGAIMVLFLYYGATVLGEIWTLPQWIIFATLILVTQIGATKARLNSKSSNI